MLTFRVDDVSANTDIKKLYDMVAFLREKFPACRVVFAVTVFSKANMEGSVYPGAPFKDNPHHFFYDVDQIYMKKQNGIDVASHGLVHGDHSRLDYDAQEMSILMSCKLLKTDIFVPPFNRWNSTTEDVCRNNNLSLWKIDHGWRSLEHNKFEADYNLWYFHPWRYTLEEFKRALS